jgi:hypothetical protein
MRRFIEGTFGSSNKCESKMTSGGIDYIRKGSQHGFFIASLTGSVALMVLNDCYNFLLYLLLCNATTCMCMEVLM